jgi:hypothetical protein
VGEACLEDAFLEAVPSQEAGPCLGEVPFHEVVVHAYPVEAPSLEEDHCYDQMEVCRMEVLWVALSCREVVPSCLVGLSSQGVVDRGTVGEVPEGVHSLEVVVLLVLSGHILDPLAGLLDICLF